jgi:hypothetical protein
VRKKGTDKVIQFTEIDKPSHSDREIHCPHCGGRIKAGATICKHCRESVNEVELPQNLPVKKGRVSMVVPAVLMSMVYGIIFLGLLVNSPQEYQRLDPDSQKALDVILLTFWLIVVTFALRLHYLCWNAVPEASRSLSPGVAVWLLLIPVFNFLWNFFSYTLLATSINSALPDGSKNRASVGLAVAFSLVCAMLPLSKLAEANGADMWFIQFFIFTGIYFSWLLFSRSAVKAVNDIVR